MLQSYCVEGFKSIKNRIEIDLKKTQYQILEKTNVEDGILKGCVFVGANASGKTNLIEALHFLLKALFVNAEFRWEDYLCLFSDTGVFENTYSFIIDKKTIRYYIRYQRREQLIIEELTLDSQILMERIGSNAKSSITERKDFNDIPSNSILLRELWFNTRFRGFPTLQKWYGFLLNSKYVNPHFHLIFGNEVESSLSLVEYIKANGVDELNNFLDECGFDYRIVYRPELSQRGFVFANLFVKRKGIDVEIPMRIESLGNKMLLIMLPAYLSVIKNGGMLICDEFSSGLHNDLEELMVRFFMKHAHGAQMFIVSHSTNLLTSSLLRPDQLYAVNFDAEGSNVVRFSSEQPRTGQNYEKMYLGGVFSGLPRYNEI